MRCSQFRSALSRSVVTKLMERPQVVLAGPGVRLKESTRSKARRKRKSPDVAFNIDVPECLQPTFPDNLFDCLSWLLNFEPKHARWFQPSDVVIEHGEVLRQLRVIW